MAMDLMEHEDENQRPRRIPRWLKWVLIALIPIGCGVLALLAIDATGAGRLRAVIAEARRDGSPLTFAEIEGRRKVWPDDANGARVIEAVADRLQELQKNDSLKALLKDVPWVGNADEPELGHHWPPEQVEAVHELLDQFSDTLRTIDDLANYEGGRFRLQPAANPIDTLLPHLSLVRGSLKLKTLQMTDRVMSGHTDTVVRDATVLARHGRLLADEPTIISALVGIACDGMTAGAIERVCGLTTLSADQLAGLDGILASMENPPRLYWGMLGERAMFVGAFDLLRKNDPAGREGLRMIGIPDVPGRSAIPGMRGWLTRDEAAGLKLHNRMVAAAKDSVEAARVGGEIEQTVPNLPKYCIVTRVLLPSLQRACTLCTNSTARIRCARTAMAVERYRVEQGQFPASLDELVPAHLDVVPADPFDGKAMRYKLDDAGAVIYSVGENGVDDGGMVVPLGKSGLSGKTPDVGFILLAPSKRGLPPKPVAPPATFGEAGSRPAP